MLIDRRLTASRIVVLLLLAYVVGTGSPLLPRTLLEHGFTRELVSLFLVVIGASGRVWASLYLGARKNATLVQDGPYSLCRNPLYFFSAVGALGIAIQSHRLLVVLALLLFLLVVYTRTIRAEERRLAAAFGDAFERYRAATPRFFPRFDRYRSDPAITVYPHHVLKALIGVAWWILAWYALGAVERLQLMGLIVPWVYLL